MDQDKSCLYCGKAFVDNYKGRKFCSRKCFYAFRNSDVGRCIQSNAIKQRHKEGRYVNAYAALKELARDRTGKPGHPSPYKGLTLGQIVGDEDKATVIRSRMSESARKRGFTTQQLEKMRLSRIGRFLSEEVKGRIRATNLATWSDPELKRIHGEKAKIPWQNEEWKKVMLQKALSASRVLPNSKESELKSLMDSIQPGVWQYIGDFKKAIAGKYPDFWNGSDKLIDLFGCYYHACPICRPNKTVHNSSKESADARVLHFKESGYECLIVWEHELNNIEQVKNRIVEFVNRRDTCLTASGERLRNG